MQKLIYLLLFFIFVSPIQANDHRPLGSKNIKDILLDISDKIESLEKTFLIPDNGFIEGGDASIALVELDKLRFKLKKLEGDVENIEFNLNAQLALIEKNIDKISQKIKEFDDSFELEKSILDLSRDKENNLFDEKKNLNELNDFGSLKKAKTHLENREYESAKVIFKNFISSFPNNSLLPEVFFYLAETYYNNNEWKLSANSYLESFSLDPKGNFAPLALFGLSISLGALKQFDQACLTLEEVNLRFPGQNVVGIDDILDAKKLLNCD